MATNRSLAPVPDTVPAPDTGIFSDARIAMIRNTIAKDAPEDVFRAMIDIARKRNLDPLAKQIQCVRFGGSWQFITTIDGHRAIAEQTGQYAGNDAPVFTWPEPPEKTKAGKKRPESATVTVYKVLHGQRFSFAATVFWDEYNTGINNWSTMPATMLAKVAESHALRKAFPAVLSGTYTGDEMEQAGYVETPGGMADRHTGEIAPPSRQERPQRAERPAAKAEVVNPGGDDDSPESAMRKRLHRYVDHEPLHHWAVSLKYASLKDVPMAALVDLANKISKPAGKTLFLQQHGAPEPHPADDFEVMEDEAENLDAAQPPLYDDPDLNVAADRIQAADRFRQ